MFKSKLRCRSCGHVQKDRAWEKEMDRIAKAMGQRGFVNLGARPQCLSCGSTDLQDTSKPVDDAEEREREYIRQLPERQRLVELMLEWDRVGENKRTGNKIKKVGQSLADQGGQALMYQVCMSLDQPRWQNVVSAYFHGIDGWMH